MTKLIDPDHYPAVTRAVNAGVFHNAGGADPNDQFDFGLQRVLDGIEALLNSRDAAP